MTALYKSCITFFFDASCILSCMLLTLWLYSLLSIADDFFNLIFYVASYHLLSLEIPDRGNVSDAFQTLSALLSLNETPYVAGIYFSV